MTQAAASPDALDLMAADEMADPTISAGKLLAGPRCRRYDRFEPPFYIVSRYEDVERVLREPETFVSGHGQGPNFALPVGVVSDPPKHTFFRRLVQEDFLPRSIGQLRPRLEAIAEELLDAVAGREVWDLHDDLAFPLPVTIICEIFGIPTDDIAQFKRWSDASVAALSAQDPSEYLAEMGRMREYVLELLHRRRAEGDDDRLLARIARARLDGEYLSDEEAVGLVLQLFVAGNETTTSLITNFVWRLLSNERLWADFCAGRCDLDLAINESLRFDPPLLGLFRTTAREVEVGGTSIPAHTKVLTHYGAANRDPAAFSNPNVFDPQRQGRKILSFGLGIHVCLGMELAKLEARVALDALRRRCPDLQLVDDGERIGPFLFWGRRRLPVRNRGN
ncbi:MAG: cytochrome P450 [Gammaproteobacteria bacterium]|nr:cytochrome P450 [Gammaproteobacteria bacterium]